MSEMKGRVADAIGAAIRRMDPNFYSRLTSHDEDNLACAAIEVMREPTDKMCDAGESSPQDHDRGLMSYSVWTFMIDEALK